MPKLCTLAVGTKYEVLALQLQTSLPAHIAIYSLSNLPADAVVHPPKKGFNFNCKRIPIEREYDPEGTLFLDADTTCVNRESFDLFLGALTHLESGIHAVHSYNAYGEITPVSGNRFLSGLSSGQIKEDRLAKKLAFFKSVYPLSKDDLAQMVFPVEWFLFCKFENERQKDTFFDRWKLLEGNLLNSKIQYLGGESYSIGMAAQHVRLPIRRLTIRAGLSHKNIRTI
jgi:hypothetical protein